MEAAVHAAVGQVTARIDRIEGGLDTKARAVVDVMLDEVRPVIEELVAKRDAKWRARAAELEARIEGLERQASCQVLARFEAKVDALTSKVDVLAQLTKALVHEMRT